MLSGVFLNALDNKLRTFIGSLESGFAVAVSYVDCIVICSTDLSLTPRIKSLVISSIPELVFTCHEPSRGAIRFLDLNLLLEHGLCCRYGKDTRNLLFSAKKLWCCFGKKVHCVFCCYLSLEALLCPPCRRGG